MGERARALAAKGAAIRLETFYEAPEAEDRYGVDYDRSGRITAEWLVRNTPHAAATYYLCGPKPFLRNLVNGLLRAGVPADRIRYEFFGPADDLSVDEVREAA